MNTISTEGRGWGRERMGKGRGREGKGKGGERRGRGRECAYITNHHEDTVVHNLSVTCTC